MKYSSFIYIKAVINYHNFYPWKVYDDELYMDASVTHIILLYYIRKVDRDFFQTIHICNALNAISVFMCIILFLIQCCEVAIIAPIL